MKTGDNITLMDKETKETYQGVFSSQNDSSISLKNVKGYRRKILVFNKSEFSIL